MAGLKHIGVDQLMRWAYGGSNSYVVLAEGEALAASKRHLSLYVDATATEAVQVHDIRVINLQVGAVTGASTRFDVHRFTTAHTGGTDLTGSIRKLDTRSPNVSSLITARRAGTVTLAELLFPFVVGTDEVTDASGGQTGADLYFPYGFGVEPIRCNPGEGLVINQVTGTTAGSLGFLFAFSIINA